MISKIPNTEVTGLLMNLYDREAGEFENTAGRMVAYDAACVVVVLPLGNAQGRSMKYKIRPEIIAKAKAATDNVHWGCLVSVQVEGSNATDLVVLDDLFANIFK